MSIEEMNKIIEEIKKVVNKLPEDTNSDFSKEITQYVKKFIDNKKRDLYIQALEKIVNDTDSLNDETFAAFYILVVYYRQMHNNAKLGKLIKENQESFSHKPLYIFSCSAYELTQRTQDNYERALQLSEKCLEIIQNPNNDYDSEYVGFYNHYATVVIAFLEKKYDIEPEKVKLAKKYIKKCIFLNDSYPTYYATLGKLEIFENQFESASNHIQKAIDLEEDRGRITEYNDLLVKIEYTKSMVEFVALVQDNKRLIEENKTNTLEYLGFFSGIMAFVITSANMVVSQPNIAIRIILLMMGALIVGFASFILLLQTNRSRIKYIASTIVIGVIIILFSIFIIT